MELVEKTTLKATTPKFEIGDTVDVHVRILEGDKERIQIYNGVVIARSGQGPREMFVVRRIVQGEGVERKFPLQSPRITDIVVKRSGKVSARQTLLPARAVRQSRPAQGAVQQHVGSRGQGRQGRAPQGPRRQERRERKGQELTRRPRIQRAARCNKRPV